MGTYSVELVTVNEMDCIARGAHALFCV